jgi:hypothetical protein
MRAQPYAWVFVALLVGLAAPADAKRAVCAEPLGPPAPIQSADREPPTAPVVHRAVMYSDGLSIGAEFSADTHRVQILYQSATGETVELWTTPQRTYLCAPATSRPVEISITAVDEAGNPSTTLGTLETVEYRGRRHRCGLGVMAFFLVGIPILAIALGLAALLRFVRRRRKLALPGEPISPLVAETMARAVVDAKAYVIAIGLVLSMLLYFSDDPVYALIVAYVPVSRLLHLIRARRFVAMLDTLGIPATLHDGTMLATHTGHIVVPRSIVRDSMRRAVPAAISRG